MATLQEKNPKMDPKNVFSQKSPGFLAFETSSSNLTSNRPFGLKQIYRDIKFVLKRLPGQCGGWTLLVSLTVVNPLFFWLLPLLKTFDSSQLSRKLCNSKLKDIMKFQSSGPEYCCENTLPAMWLTALQVANIMHESNLFLWFSWSTSTSERDCRANLLWNKRGKVTPWMSPLTG